MKAIDGDALARRMLAAYRDHGAEYMKANYLKFVYEAPELKPLDYPRCPCCGKKAAFADKATL